VIAALDTAGYTGPERSLTRPRTRFGTPVRFVMDDAPAGLRTAGSGSTPRPSTRSPAPILAPSGPNANLLNLHGKN